MGSNLVSKVREVRNFHAPNNNFSSAFNIFAYEESFIGQLGIIHEPWFNMSLNAFSSFHGSKRMVTHQFPFPGTLDPSVGCTLPVHTTHPRLCLIFYQGPVEPCWLSPHWMLVMFHLSWDPIPAVFELSESQIFIWHPIVSPGISRGVVKFIFLHFNLKKKYRPFSFFKRRRWGVSHSAWKWILMLAISFLGKMAPFQTFLGHLSNCFC